MMPQRPDDDDRDEDPLDDGPSEEDKARFSEPVIRQCPDCGHAVIEDADICPKCHAFLWENPEAQFGSKGRPWWGIFILLTVVLILTLSGLMAVLLR